MNLNEYINLENQYGANNYRPLDIVIKKGRGIWVWDIEGKKYLDCLAGYSALNQGHCHPKIIEALKKQAAALTLTSRAFRNDQLAFYYRKLCQLTGFEKVLPMNTGAEAVETAIKLARKWGYQKKGIKKNKAEIIVCENNFHGRTTTIVSFSTDRQYWQGFGPFAKGFKIVKYDNARAIAKAINKNTVAVLLEPVQGEGGIIFPQSGYLKSVRRICSKNKVLLMLDEIQTGFGRTGKLFAYEYERIRPDVLIIGKALSGGVYPISAVLAADQLMSVFTPGDHGSTFGGNPLAAAIGLAALEVLQKEKLVENSAILGRYLLTELKKIKSDLIKEVRGKGLFIGIELKDKAGGARKYCEKLMSLGLLCKETHKKVIRLAPPLIISKKEIDWLLIRLKKILAD